MIRVTVELVPAVSGKAVEQLAVIEIANVSPPGPFGDYSVRCGDASHTIRAHRRSDGWQVLVQRALRALARNGGCQ